MTYVAITTRVLVACPLSVWDGVAPGCHWCGADLPARRRSWCSDACSVAFLGNHQWQVARVVALERTRWTCERCGRIGWRDVPASVGLAVGSRRWSEWRALEFERTSWYHAARTMGRLGELMDRERRAWLPRYSSWGQPARHDLEVNHRTPLAGRRPTEIACVHHQDGLEVLCRPCHYAETTRQRRAGELARVPS